MVLFYAFSVIVQYNDPDPIRWMVIYGAAMIVSAVLPLRRAIARRAALAGLVTGVICAVWFAILLAGIWGKVTLGDIPKHMSEKGGAVEEEREAGGMLIEAVWMLGACAYRRRRA
jgi:urea transporter